MKNNIRRLRRERGWSQQELGDRVGLSWQSISNIERGQTSLTARNIEKVAEVFGCEPADIVSADDGTRRVPVVGYVQAGVFAESHEFEEGDSYDVFIENEPRLRQFRLEGREVRGPSMNRRYPEKTVVIITDMVETGAAIVEGKRYVVERERADGMREATVKKLWRDSTGKFWLLPESDDPRYQEPIPLEGGENDTVRIVGMVRYAVTRED